MAWFYISIFPLLVGMCLVYINDFQGYFVSHEVLFQEHGVVCCTFHPMLYPGWMAV